jgi:hypothetical protein
MNPEATRAIKTRQDFTEFVRQLLADLQSNPQAWANQSLADYLEAVSAWTQDMEGFYSRRKEPIPEQPTWRTLAEILAAARVYE